ncbi:MAG: glucose-1-phosphate adenylyltransferase subunit GlgD [Acutalibacteraceae bacterium]|nr:glucose-1-phosphate adenylyltransferase subunit GlgD [Acutalibacteraceae bacterium]
MRTSAVAGIVLANINDTLLEKLTSKRSMASVPFGARYRLIDFPLSNLVNAGVTSVGIITKENYRSLMDHVGNGVYWDLDRKNGGLYLLPPYLTRGTKKYNGTVDALHGAIDYIDRCNAEYIVLCHADTIANINFNAALKSHIERNADITLVYHNGKPSVNNANLMLFQMDGDERIESIGFEPKAGEDADYFAGSMIVSRKLLMQLVEDAYSEGLVSFNENVLADMTDKLKIYGFRHNEFVAVLNGTDAYYEANMALLEKDVRRQLFGRSRPVFTKTRDDMPTRYGTKSNVKNSIIADGCVINGTVKNSVLFRGVTVEKDAVVENCILMQETAVGTGADIKNVIADKNAAIGDNMVLKGTPEKCVFVKKNQVL